MSIVFFCMQIVFLYINANFQVEYIDNRLFYIINMTLAICLLISIYFLIKQSKKLKVTYSIILIIFIVSQIIMVIISEQKISNMTSISPDFKHVFSIKENVKTGESLYYRSYYGILAKPKEKLPYHKVGNFKVEWIEKDIAAITYKTAEETIQQYIGTYGDRGDGVSYYYVGAEIHGVWSGENIEVVSNTEGISVTENGHKELFSWDSIEQFGTLAIVLKRENQAIWTIGLHTNFEVQSNSTKPAVGNISLYKATMSKIEPVRLHFKTSTQ